MIGDFLTKSHDMRVTERKKWHIIRVDAPLFAMRDNKMNKKGKDNLPTWTIKEPTIAGVAEFTLKPREQASECSPAVKADKTEAPTDVNTRRLPWYIFLTKIGRSYIPHARHFQTERSLKSLTSRLRREDEEGADHVKRVR